MGYFRIFYYISYTLNFIFRMIKRHGKFILLFFSIAVFLIVCNMPLKSHAYYLGDDSYFDPYEAIQQKYDSICMDFIRRIEFYKNSQYFDSSIYDTLVNRFSNLDYYLYYNATTTDDFGISSVNSSIYNDYGIRVFFYTDNNNGISVSSSIYDNYYGINDDIRSITVTSTTGGSRNFFLYGSTTFQLSRNSLNLNDIYYIPQFLFHYQSRYIYEYFINNTSLEQIELMYEMDSKLASIDDTLQQQQEYLEQEPSSDDFSSDDIPSDSGVTNPTDTGLDTYFSSFYNIMTANPNTLDMLDKNHIDVPIPFTRKKLYYSL